MSELNETAEPSGASGGSVLEKAREVLRSLAPRHAELTDGERRLVIALSEVMYEVARLRLTDEEREAIDAAILFMESRGVMGWAATLRGLLERTK